MSAIICPVCLAQDACDVCRNTGIVDPNLEINGRPAYIELDETRHQLQLDEGCLFGRDPWPAPEGRGD